MGLLLPEDGDGLLDVAAQGGKKWKTRYGTSAICTYILFNGLWLVPAAFIIQTYILSSYLPG